LTLEINSLDFKQVLKKIGIEMEAPESFFRCANQIVKSDPGFWQKFIDAIFKNPVEVGFKHLENYTNDYIFDEIVKEAKKNGSTAFRRKCEDCGRPLDILLLRDDSSQEGVRTVSEDAVYFGRWYTDNDTSYEKWLCADVVSFDTEHGFRCGKKKMDS
jgi:hypothetical protein